jgi:copper(I)-binding protein
MRKLIGVVASVSLVSGLVACGSEPAAPVDTSPEAPQGISVTDGRMNLPAVAGSPGAVYFTLVNDSGKDAAIVGAWVDGASNAEIHGPMSEHHAMAAIESLHIGPESELVFQPGKYHVMAFDIDPSLQVGGETEVTLTFDSGDKVSFPARLLATGDDGSNMEMGE